MSGANPCVAQGRLQLLRYRCRAPSAWISISIRDCVTISFIRECVCADVMPECVSERIVHGGSVAEPENGGPASAQSKARPRHDLEGTGRPHERAPGNYLETGKWRTGNPNGCFVRCARRSRPRSCRDHARQQIRFRGYSLIACRSDVQSRVVYRTKW